MSFYLPLNRYRNKFKSKFRYIKKRKLLHFDLIALTANLEGASNIVIVASVRTSGIKFPPSSE